MAHVAELNEKNEVLRVIVVHNDYEPDVEAWAENWAGGGIWKRTSYTASIRKNFAGIGFIYDEKFDAFIPPKCHDEAILDKVICQWSCGNVDHEPEKS